MSRKKSSGEVPPPPPAPAATTPADSGSELFWESKVADSLGVARERIAALRVERLTEGPHFRIVRNAVVLIGLACKNAILIVEFAKLRRDAGEELHASILAACRLRLRPILMTSFAFILGVVPLVIAKGAGFEMRRALGTAVFSACFSQCGSPGMFR